MPRWSCSSLLLISACSMPHLFAELGSDRSGIGVMPIGGDPIWSDAGHRLGRSKECPGSSEVTMLAQHDVHQGAIAINRPIQIPPSARTRIYVSSMYQLGPILPLRRRRRFSASAGVSLASQSRTAS